MDQARKTKPVILYPVNCWGFNEIIGSFESPARLFAQSS
jgi:hypothetical protein